MGENCSLYPSCQVFLSSGVVPTVVADKGTKRWVWLALDVGTRELFIA